MQATPKPITVEFNGTITVPAAQVAGLDLEGLGSLVGGLSAAVLGAIDAATPDGCDFDVASTFGGGAAGTTGDAEA